MGLPGLPRLSSQAEEGLSILIPLSFPLPLRHRRRTPSRDLTRIYDKKAVRVWDSHTNLLRVIDMGR